MSAPEFKFDAVYYHVSDMEKSIAFYRNILGFRLASRDYVARFDLDGVLFELVPNPQRNASRGTGNARLSLGVTDIQQATVLNPDVPYASVGCLRAPSSKVNP
jgi:catechol 2,3-dioxygenase-like lactoylglutathione lyase family enzyme